MGILPYFQKSSQKTTFYRGDPGDLVLDPFCGSGTTGKMAIKNARNFLGIEISEEYAELSRKRIAASLPVNNSPEQKQDFLEGL